MTPDPRTERIRRYVDACKVNRIEVHVAPADLVYLLGRIEALEDVAEVARRAVTQRHDEIAHGDAIPPYHRPDCGHRGNARHTKRCVNPEFTAWNETRSAMASARVTVAELESALAVLDGGEGE